MKLIFISLLTTTLITSLLAGCNNINPGNKQDTAVYLDLGAIARALGRDEIIKQQQQAAIDQLNAQLLQISRNLDKQLKEEKSTLGKKPGAEKQQRFNEATINANKQLQQSQLLAKQKLTVFRQQLAIDFQNEVKSVARPIATERGAVSITIIDNNVLWIDPSADITGEIIASMRAKIGSEVKSSGSHAKNPTGTTTAPTPDDEIRELDKLVNQIEKESSE